MTVRADFLVIGSGIAGLRAAISLADAGDVVILTKADPRESNTGYAQGGIAAAIGADDSPALHAADTHAAGDGLCLPAAVDVLVESGPAYVHELLEWGAAFDRDADGRPALAREAAHSVRRVLHAHDATGREISRVLWQKVAVHPRVRVLDQAQATALLVDGHGACGGACFVDEAGTAREVAAARTLIASGGAGQVFRETTNPAVATGDGIAMAYDAGARVADLEFVQFHPTVLSVAGSPRFLLSEALRGEGARLVNAAGERFMTRYEPAGDLASRDLVARAIVRESLRTGAPVFLTLAHLDAEFVRRRFPTIAAACQAAGLDLALDRIPVSPAAHYVMGGVETDLDGRTSLPALFAAGEAACTGVHGANRLASNSLLEGLVFGARAAAAMQGALVTPQLFAEPAPDADTAAVPTAVHVPDEAAVRDLVWRHAGLVRERDTLAQAVAQLRSWRAALRSAAGQAPGEPSPADRAPADRARADPAPADPALRRVGSLITVGLLVARAALRREESRGGHFRSDFPGPDDILWRKHVADAR